MKKLLSIILAILMVVTMIPMAVLPASAAEYLDHNIKVEIVDWTVYDAGQVIGQFNAAKHGDAFYDVSFTQADDGTFTYSYLLALERNGGNTAWDENSISFKIDSCEEEFSQVFEKSFVSKYYIEYNIKVSRSAGHSLVQVDSQAPICTENGWDEYECTICDNTTYVEIPAINHKDTLVQVEGKDATCTEAGYEAYEYCTECDYTTFKEIAAAGHTYEEIVTDPTCTEAGYTTYTCACGDTYVADEVEALGHTYEEVVTAPTCTEAGYTTYTCACGDTYVADEVEALGHTDADGDNQCDNGCGYEFENDDCNHMCHKQGFMGFIWKIVKFFSKLFGTNPTCECGVVHY